jgi:thiol-disulfide isomerase/thioredoxin
MGYFSNAQVTYYKTTDGVLMTEENYLQIKKEMNEREDLAGKYQEIFIKSENQNDTIIKIIKFEKILLALGKNNKKYDPYAEQRKLIGSHFPIELFKDEAGNYFSKDYLKGKPSIINFWFTNCPPCIEEIPDLYKLKKEFGDSVNFIAITFDSRKKVEKFLKKRPYFDFMHITDSQKSINKLKIESFPMTFILNQNGEIINLYGGTLMFQLASLEEIIQILTRSALSDIL